MESPNNGKTMPQLDIICLSHTHIHLKIKTPLTLSVYCVLSCLQTSAVISPVRFCPFSGGDGVLLESQI